MVKQHPQVDIIAITRTQKSYLATCVSLLWCQTDVGRSLSPWAAGSCIVYNGDQQAFARGVNDPLAALILFSPSFKLFFYAIYLLIKSTESTVLAIKVLNQKRQQHFFQIFERPPLT